MNIHASDCATHNAPAYPAGACDCSADLPAASPATKGICSDERMCAACYSGQSECETAASQD